MIQLLNRPEIQSAVLPFIIGLLAYLGLSKATLSPWVWAVLAAFLVSVGLINGLTITPLTGTRKIILLILASCFVGGLLEPAIRSSVVRQFVLSVLGVLAMLWVFWKVLIRMEIPEIAVFLGGSVALVVWLVWAFDRIGGDGAKLHGAGFSLLLGTGLSAMAGASALLGQLALSLSAASGGVLLGWVLKGNVAGAGSGSSAVATWPYALAAALFGLAAVMLARLPWYALIPLAFIPVVTGAIPKITNARFVNALVSSAPGVLIAIAVAFSVWQLKGAGSGY